MKAPLWVALMVASSLLFLYGVVFGLGDRQVMVAPPEAVTEGFMRSLAAHRYPQALPFLSDDLQKRTPPGDLKAFTRRIEEEHGPIEDVSGEPGWMKGDRAGAYAVLQTQRANDVKLDFQLERSEGAWSISRIGGRNK